MHFVRNVIGHSALCATHVLASSMSTLWIWRSLNAHMYALERTGSCQEIGTKLIVIVVILVILVFIVMMIIAILTVMYGHSHQQHTHTHLGSPWLIRSL